MVSDNYDEYALHAGAVSAGHAKVCVQCGG